MPTRSANTMAEGLQGMLNDIGNMKVAPDADLEFLIGLETAIIQKLREPLDRAANQVPGLNPATQGGMGMGGGPPVPGGGAPMPVGAMPPGMIESMLPAAAPQAGAGVNGLRATPAMPNADELRRALPG